MNVVWKVSNTQEDFATPNWNQQNTKNLDVLSNNMETLLEVTFYVWTPNGRVALHLVCFYQAYDPVLSIFPYGEL